jgi:hypothetical protein
MRHRCAESDPYRAATSLRKEIDNIVIADCTYLTENYSILRAQSSVNESGKMRNSSLQGSIQQIHYKLHRTGDKVGEGSQISQSSLCLRCRYAVFSIWVCLNGGAILYSSDVAYTIPSPTLSPVLCNLSAMTILSISFRRLVAAR